MGNEASGDRRASIRTDRSQSAPPDVLPPAKTLCLAPSSSTSSSSPSYNKSSPRSPSTKTVGYKYKNGSPSFNSQQYNNHTTHLMAKKRRSTMNSALAPYHEKQSWEMCLMHALNTLFQHKKFTNDDMDRICKQLAPDKMINPHKSILQTGNYDANVLMMALHQEGVDVQWFDSRKAQSDLSLNDDFLCPKDKYAEFLGFIVNNQQKKMLVFNRRHWLTIKRIKGVWYDLDSKKAAPKPMEEKDLLKWLITECKNDAQLMICRRVKGKGSAKKSKKQKYAGPLQTASQLKVNDVQSRRYGPE